MNGAVFEAERPRLRGLAYRMLGTISDVDDVVQDTWLRWQAVDPDALDRPEAWLTTVTTRLCLDRIRTARRRREEYIGPWLPEPLVSEGGPEQAAELADSLTLGFLTVLDRLGPVERAVFLLADVFAVPYAEIAETVGKSEAACRQVASRARSRLRGASPDGAAAGRSAPRDRQLVDELVLAIGAGDIAGVLARLAPDAVCISDGGSIRRAARRPVVGAPRVARFLVNLTHRYAGAMSLRPVTINGDAGVLISLDGVVDLVAAFETQAGRVRAIRIVRNPDKLGHVGDEVTLV
jgi:RNA polymerase sigma-70 factor (ECF subfamily)